MQLPYITTVTPYGMSRGAGIIDFSGSYIPKLTTFCFGDTSDNTHYTKEIKINNITAPNITTLANLCRYHIHLINIESSGLDTSKVTNMSYSFSNCRKLPSLDLSHWNFESVTNLDHAFYQCYELTDLKLPEINTANMNIDYAFCDCNKITNLNTVTFDLTTTPSARSLFNRCYALSDVNFVSTDAPNMTSMYYMFASCYAMENINLSGLIGSAVTTIGYAF